jgi:hypothetical protein
MAVNESEAELSVVPVTLRSDTVPICAIVEVKLGWLGVTV